MKYYRKLVGERLYLSPINLEDIDKYTEWINDLEIAINLGNAAAVFNQEKEKEMLEKLIEEGHHFAIVSEKSDELLGNCGIFDLDKIHKTGEIGIFIGNRNFWNKGYGSEAINLLLDYGFNILNLHNISLSVYSFNKRAISCYEKLGFKVIGNRREAREIAGQKYDEIYMDILASEFEGRIFDQLKLNPEH
ncbi:GNAT family N-acetyltransferase [Halanaerobiaceae bacterium Z-7014]|uniref:GNAT family N-acetyltransferase n=1 Tax=Halonatronomonas betaini TaxID=2778430 RepID=A0A931AW66_9FIRM|nr:GNAT family protein [Halonatronomonas betaini]MBF8437895.1 GNAT family N-acetyltransferase [Halonatronomonas betaini]